MFVLNAFISFGLACVSVFFAKTFFVGFCLYTIHDRSCSHIRECELWTKVCVVVFLDNMWLFHLRGVSDFCSHTLCFTLS